MSFEILFISMQIKAFNSTNQTCYIVRNACCSDTCDVIKLMCQLKQLEIFKLKRSSGCGKAFVIFYQLFFRLFREGREEYLVILSLCCNATKALNELYGNSVSGVKFQKLTEGEQKTKHLMLKYEFDWLGDNTRINTMKEFNPK